MLKRTKVELDFIRLYDLHHHGLTVFCPLAAGVLTGKYNNGIPSDSRIAVFKDDSDL